MAKERRDSYLAMATNFATGEHFEVIKLSKTTEIFRIRARNQFFEKSVSTDIADFSSQSEALDFFELLLSDIAEGIPFFDASDHPVSYSKTSRGPIRSGGI
jgi:hypothetical protein